jgi:hypothetical protein
MVQLRVHAANEPGETWLEVDGAKLLGVDSVLVVEDVKAETFSLSIIGQLGQDVEIVWEDDSWEEQPA